MFQVFYFLLPTPYSLLPTPYSLPHSPIFNLRNDRNSARSSEVKSGSLEDKDYDYLA